MTARVLDVDVLRDDRWQMHYGERFALEGLLRSLQPGLSIEVGRAEGGSLRRLARHSGEVHSFDLVEGPAELRTELTNVEFHTGDSTVQVPETLRALSAEGRTVDFALVDGDHSADGVRRDAEALLGADCCTRTVIVFHDAANDDVRAGLEAVRFAEHPKVALAMLDFVPGFLVEHGPYRGHIWNGLGLVILGENVDEVIVERDRFDAAAVARLARDRLFQAEQAAQVEPPAPVPSDSGVVRDRVPAIAAATAGLLAGVGLGALAGRRGRG